MSENNRNKRVQVGAGLRQVRSLVMGHVGQLQLLAVMLIVAWLMNWWTAHTIVPQYATSDVMMQPLGMAVVGTFILTRLSGRLSGRLL